MNKNTFFRNFTSNSRQIPILGSVTSMREQTRLFHNKITTDSDSECSYVANLADFHVIRVIVIVIKTIVIKIVYNSKKSNNSNSYSNNGNKIVIPKM